MFLKISYKKLIWLNNLTSRIFNRKMDQLSSHRLMPNMHLWICLKDKTASPRKTSSEIQLCQAQRVFSRLVNSSKISFSPYTEMHHHRLTNHQSCTAKNKKWILWVKMTKTNLTTSEKRNQILENHAFYQIYVYSIPWIFVTKFLIYYEIQKFWPIIYLMFYWIDRKNILIKIINFQ